VVACRSISADLLPFVRRCCFARSDYLVHLRCTTQQVPSCTSCLAAGVLPSPRAAVPPDKAPSPQVWRRRWRSVGAAAPVPALNLRGPCPCFPVVLTLPVQRPWGPPSSRSVRYRRARRSWPVAKLRISHGVWATGTLLVLGASWPPWKRRQRRDVSRARLRASTGCGCLSLETDLLRASAWRCSFVVSIPAQPAPSCGGPPSLQPSSARLGFEGGQAAYALS